MTNQDHQSEGQSISVAPGDMLKQAREKQSLSLEHVAKHLCLTVRHIQNIEDNEFENSPGPIFERGYIRAYARLLGLSEEDVLAGFTGLHFKSNEKQSLPIGMYVPPITQRGKKYHWLFAAIALIVIAIVFVWMQMQKQAPSHDLHGLANQSTTLSQSHANPIKQIPVTMKKHKATQLLQANEKQNNNKS